MKPRHSKKGIKRKYKRIAAALAGAAVITSAMLPGIPVFKVHASPNAANVSASPVTASDLETGATSAPLKVARQHAGEYGFDTSHDRFSLQKRTDTEAVVLVQTGDVGTYKMVLKKDDNNQWQIVSVYSIDRDIAAPGDPVTIVMDNAARFGFDAANDRFSLLSLTAGKAIVQVRTSGQTFKVDLVKKNGSWEITTIRGIGNAKYPATFIPASMFYYGAAVTQPVVSIDEQKVLFQTDKFAGWSWNQETYPGDIDFGVLIQDPRLIDTTNLIPASVMDLLKDIDLTNKFVLYAYLGTTPASGYGIGIEKVVQTGNDFTVTIKARSPLANETQPAATKAADYIAIDRSALDFSNPIIITFVDGNGTILSQYTLIRR